jgi:hypothetical protein
MNVIESLIEKDTFDDEDLSFSNILQFLYPPQDTLQSLNQFSLSYNRKIFEGWVKQPSPCCAAAVVASSWNSLASIHRNNINAKQHNHVLDIFKIIFQQTIDKKKNSFQRKLGCSSIDDVLANIDVEFECLPCDNIKKGPSITMKRFKSIMRNIIAKYITERPVKLSNEESSHESQPKSANAAISIELIYELMQAEGILNEDVNEMDDGHLSV